MREPPQRILVVRLDRIGDVVLSTPVIQALRAAFPSAFIAMMVRPACRELLEGHPALDEVLVYDKARIGRGLLSGWRFARNLRRRGFDTALVLHPTVRSHLLVWLAGIPVRVGYGRKAGWLLTRRLAHHKQEGRKSEAEYALDMLRVFGIEPPPARPTIPVRAGAAERVAAWLAEQGLDARAPLIALHPAAGARSKRWAAERFAVIADRLARERGARIVLVAGEPERAQADAVAAAMRTRPLDAAGRLSVAELAALLARCRLLVSNDAGPVHIAAAVGTPVVAIFGRNQPGLGATRWGPVGAGHVVVQKDVGCRVCLAEACQISFRCLEELQPDEVYQAAVSVLDRGKP